MGRADFLEKGTMAYAHVFSETLLKANGGIQANSSMRIYSARLLGTEPDLGCMVGGAASVKTIVKNSFGELAESSCTSHAAVDRSRKHRTSPNLFHCVGIICFGCSWLPGLSDRELEATDPLGIESNQVQQRRSNALLHAVIQAEIRRPSQRGRDFEASPIRSSRRN